MVVLWLLDAALVVLEWFLSLWATMPTLSLPAPISVQIPTPGLGAGAVSSLNAFLPVFVVALVAMSVGNVLQWLYRLIPFKMT